MSSTPFYLDSERRERRRASKKEVRTLARRAADLALEASMDGLDAATAVMAAAIHVSFDAEMNRHDIADWLRRLADEMEAENYGAEVRSAMKSTLKKE